MADDDSETASPECLRDLLIACRDSQSCGYYSAKPDCEANNGRHSRSGPSGEFEHFLFL